MRPELNAENSVLWLEFLHHIEVWRFECLKVSQFALVAPSKPNKVSRRGHNSERSLEKAISADAPVKYPIINLEIAYNHECDCAASEDGLPDTNRKKLNLTPNQQIKEHQLLISKETQNEPGKL